MRAGGVTGGKKLQSSSPFQKTHPSPQKKKTVESPNQPSTSSLNKLPHHPSQSNPISVPPHLSPKKSIIQKALSQLKKVPKQPRTMNHPHQSQFLSHSHPITPGSFLFPKTFECPTVHPTKKKNPPTPQKTEEGDRRPASPRRCTMLSVRFRSWAVKRVDFQSRGTRHIRGHRFRLAPR